MFQGEEVGGRSVRLTRRMLAGAAVAVLEGCAAVRLTQWRSVDVESIDRERVLRLANNYLRARPVTITALRSTRSPGGIHDYYSEGDYWWPNPADVGGAYVQRDGFSNPDRFDAHRQALIRLGLIVPALAAAWTISRHRRYGDAAAHHLNAWFADPATRMNPKLDHAQAIIGINTGRGIGLIDTLQLVEVARGAARLRETGYALDPRIIRWFGDYLSWMRTSKSGMEEREQKNNHGSCWVLQVAEFAKLVGDETILNEARHWFRTRLIPQQIAPNGSQPLELARTKPFGYSLFNLDVLSTVAHSLSRPGDDLWRFATSDGRSLGKALAFMAPFIADKERWLFRRDVQHWGDWPVRHPSLLFGGLALREPAYIALWRRLPPDPSVSEIIRNYPIRQPVLWL